MEPLIIIATPNISWLHPDVDYPRSPESIAEEAALCRQNGASILHTHAEGRWTETIRAVRSTSDIIVQCGMSSLPIADRMDVFRENADMISIILNHHDEAFARTECNALHLKPELEEYARLCAEYSVIPEFEVWHTGSIWNLNYLIEKRAIRPPYVTTLFLGWPGGTWSPPTIEEYLYRRKNMPAGCVCNVSIMGDAQRDIVSTAILLGDHVRVGTEDYPFNHFGQVVPTHELVKETAELARAIGRPVATPDQARKMIGL
ncbi:MAG: 3-keto-5-aminohexanoate cleavage protein [Chloroflexi bacterium]|nr:3-keto-5-aminohexanoate cleavage protein [Chloroflexota bacterium]